MALPTESDYVLEASKIALALNVMWADDKVGNPHHPLRQLLRHFKMDDDGTVHVNNKYISEAYAGKYPTDPENIETKIFKLAP